MLKETGLEEQAIEMAALGTERFPACVELWKRRLELLIDRQEPVKQVQKLLKQAQTKVPAKVVHILCSVSLLNNSEPISDKVLLYVTLVSARLDIDVQLECQSIHGTVIVHPSFHHGK